MSGILGALIASVRARIAWATLATTTSIYTDSIFDSGTTAVVHDSGDSNFKTLNVATGATSTIVADGGFRPGEGSLTVGASSAVFAWERSGGLYKYQSGAVSAVSLTNGAAGIATNRSGTWLVVSGNDIAYSSDNMGSWTQTANILGAISADAAAYMIVSSTPTWAAFDSGTTSYYTSTNLSTWTSRTLPFTLLNWRGRNQVISEGGYAYAIAATTFNVWRTADFVNWTDLGNPSGTTTQTSRKLSVSGSKLVYSYEYTPATSGTLYSWYSTNNGTSWSLLPFATADNSGSISSFTQYTSGAAGGSFYLSVNAGTERYTSVSI